MGLESIPSVKSNITIATMIKLDGDLNGHGDYDSTCKENLFSLKYTMQQFWPPMGMINVMNSFCYIS